VDALIVPADPFFTSQRDRSGGLMSYGPRFAEAYR
jgi:hypothetical protein